jgi:hypothetical protein
MKKGNKRKRIILKGRFLPERVNYSAYYLKKKLPCLMEVRHLQ